MSRWKGNLAVLWTLPYYGSILLRLFFLCLKDIISGANQLPEIDQKITVMDFYFKNRVSHLTHPPPKSAKKIRVSGLPPPPLKSLSVSWLVIVSVLPPL